MAYTTPFWINVGDYVKKSDAEKLFDNSAHIISNVLGVETPGTTTAIRATLRTGATPALVGNADNSYVIFCGGSAADDGAYLQLHGDGSTSNESDALISVGDAALTDAEFKVQVITSGGTTQALGVTKDYVRAIGSDTGYISLAGDTASSIISASSEYLWIGASSQQLQFRYGANDTQRYISFAGVKHILLPAHAGDVSNAAGVPSLWYDTTGDVLKYRNNAGTVKTVAVV